MAERKIVISPASPSIGAEISGVELCEALCPETVLRLRQALLDHGVIFFRDQNLAPGEQMAFAGYFGEPVEYPFI